MLTLRAIDYCQVVEHVSHLGVLRSKNLLAYCQCAVKKSLRLGESPFLTAKEGDINQDVSHFRMFRPKSLFPNLQRALEIGFRLSVILQAGLEHSQLVENNGNFGGLRAKSLSRDGQRTFESSTRPRIFALVFPNPGEVAQGEGDRDRKSTRLNSSHRTISYAVFCLKKKRK